MDHAPRAHSFDEWTRLREVVVGRAEHYTAHHIDTSFRLFFFDNVAPDLRREPRIAIPPADPRAAGRGAQRGHRRPGRRPDRLRRHRPSARNPGQGRRHPLPSLGRPGDPATQRPGPGHHPRGHDRRDLASRACPDLRERPAQAGVLPLLRGRLELAEHAAARARTGLPRRRLLPPPGHRRLPRHRGENALASTGLAWRWSSTVPSACAWAATSWSTSPTATTRWRCAGWKRQLLAAAALPPSRRHRRQPHRQRGGAAAARPDAPALPELPRVPPRGHAVLGSHLPAGSRRGRLPGLQRPSASTSPAATSTSTSCPSTRTQSWSTPTTPSSSPPGGRGFTVVPVRHRHRRLFGGGFHCFTLDTVRAGGCEEYLG